MREVTLTTDPVPLGQFLPDNASGLRHICRCHCALITLWPVTVCVGGSACRAR
jgi:hypothetical protein